MKRLQKNLGHSAPSVFVQSFCASESRLVFISYFFYLKNAELDAQGDKSTMLARWPGLTRDQRKKFQIQGKLVQKLLDAIGCSFPLLYLELPWTKLISYPALEHFISAFQESKTPLVHMAALCTAQLERINREDESAYVFDEFVDSTLHGWAGMGGADPSTFSFDPFPLDDLNLGLNFPVEPALGGRFEAPGASVGTFDFF